MTVDELYAVRPEEFVEARTSLAKELRAEGRKDEAAAVAKLRRPSVAAWGLNQVARSSPDVVEAAIAAGAELRSASEAAMAGDPGRLRTATAAERAAANAVVKAAAKHLGARADSLAPVLLATIRVAALDDEVADQLRRGVLVSDQEQPGFGFGLEGESAVAPPPKAKTKPKTKTKAKSGASTTNPDTSDREAAEREKAERTAAREAERVRKKELAARQRDADRKAREARRLAKEADEAEADAREARATANQAQADADAARLAVEELS